MLVFDHGFSDWEFTSILGHINKYSEGIGVKSLGVKSENIKTALAKMYGNFPCENGIESASVFKKAAVFVTCFIELEPLPLEAFLKSKLKPDVKKHNPNAIVALDIAILSISQAKVIRSDGEVCNIDNGIQLSHHSYCDILDMLSQDISFKQHFMPLALLFEQVVYKTHPEMQYPIKTYGILTRNSQSSLYLSSFNPGDNIPEEWSDELKLFGDLETTKKI